MLHGLSTCSIVSGLPALAIGLWCAVGAARETAPATTSGSGSGWLNAHDFGASGSEFETVATTTDGSPRIVVASVGDFQVGQGVSVSKCNIQSTVRLYGPGCPYGDGRARDAGDAVDIRGYDGSAGSWLIYIMEIESTDPPTFRWSDNLVRGNQWQAAGVPVTWDWQALSAGIEVRLAKRDWQVGEFVVFTARDQLVTSIAGIEGNTLILRHAANRSVTDAVVRHSDRTALQLAIDRAVQRNMNLFVPVGHYRLTGGHGLAVNNAAGITIEGGCAQKTILDIGEGQGACFRLQRGTEVTIRNFTLIGHTGTAEKAGYFKSSSGHSYWACALKPCNAVSVGGTERVLVENVHASRMATECFISGGPYRKGEEEPPAYTKSLTFLRCSVTDCAANAFNNCDFAENTSILYCRVDGAGWHMYEGSGRFIRIIGNYIRNAGPITIGDIPHNLPRAGLRHTEDLGIGQAIVRDNVLEGIGRCGGITICHGPTQVVVANNIFVNYNGNAITASSSTVHWSFPPQNITITGNIIDLTHSGAQARARVGINVSTSDTIVSNNQIYVRGAVDPGVRGIRLSTAARNLFVHDNLIRNCGVGLSAHNLEGQVVEVIDPTRFAVRGIPYPWRYSGFYAGWHLLWLGANKPATPWLADVFDNDNLQFRLVEPYANMQAGDRFSLAHPTANWQIHSNTITSCRSPVVLDCRGSDTSIFRDNVIERGDVDGVTEAVKISGRFTVSGNLISGFDEPDSTALAIARDASGRVPRNAYLRNTFERCTRVVKEVRPGLWAEGVAEGNLFIDCADAPSTGGTIVQREQLEPVLLPPPPRPTLLAARLDHPVTVDGTVDEWPWQDEIRVIALAQTPMGDPLPTPMGHACAAHDGANLYLAIRLLLHEGIEAIGGNGWGAGDGVEISFQDGRPGATTPIFLLWGDAAGRFDSAPDGGATPQQVAALREAVTYSARAGTGEWTCEWRIPLVAAGLDLATTAELWFNIGIHQAAGKAWGGWIGTGGALYQVRSAGKLVFAK